MNLQNFQILDILVERKCLLNDVVYEAILTQKSEVEVGKEFSYIGVTSQTFKERYQTHKHTLKHKSSKEHTALSELAHKLTERGIDYSVDWRIIEQAKSHNGLTCNLCLSEKSHILFNPASSQPAQQTHRAPLQVQTHGKIHVLEGAWKRTRDFGHFSRNTLYKRSQTVYKRFFLNCTILLHKCFKTV